MRVSVIYPYSPPTGDLVVRYCPRPAVRKDKGQTMARGCTGPANLVVLGGQICCKALVMPLEFLQEAIWAAKLRYEGY